MINIAIFVSGHGSNAIQLIKYFENHQHIKVSKIYCNNANAGILNHIDSFQIPYLLFNKNEFQNGKVLDDLKNNQIDGIVLAGFLWLIPKSFLDTYSNKIINLHPSLLPKYGGKGMYGDNVHLKVIENKEKKTGITIHIVNEYFDDGTILEQQSFEIEHYELDDIKSKIRALEHYYLPRVVEQYFLNNAF